MLNFGIILGSLGLFYTLTIFQAFNAHKLNLKYKRMLQCAKVRWRIIYVYLGELLGPMEEVGMEFKHMGVLARLETSRNLVPKFP